MFLLASTAQAKDPFTLEDAYLLKWPSDLQLSPDGQTLLFSLAERNLAKAKSKTQIWRYSFDTGSLDQLTQHEKSSWSPRWAADGKTIYFLSKRNGDTQLFAMPTSTGDVRQLTHLSTGISDLVLSGELMDYYKDKACCQK